MSEDEDLVQAIDQYEIKYGVKPTVLFVNPARYCKYFLEVRQLLPYTPLRGVNFQDIRIITDMKDIHRDDRVAVVL